MDFKPTVSKASQLHRKMTFVSFLLHPRFITRNSFLAYSLRLYYRMLKTVAVTPQQLNSVVFSLQYIQCLVLGESCLNIYCISVNNLVLIGAMCLAFATVGKHCMVWLL